MDRRGFVTGAVGLGAVSALPAPLRSQARVVSDGAVNVVDRFGFVPDGRADNYEAFHRLALFATSQRGGHFYFPPGTYWVARYRTTDVKGRDLRNVINPHFLRCDGLTLRGDRANIRLNGQFHRSEKVGPDGVQIGMYAGVFMPFEIRRSNDVLISGFEVDGGVRDMTRDPSVQETYAYLVALNACTNVTLRDLALHHSQTDAILLSDDVMLAGGRGQTCRNISLERVRCWNNARGALAPLQVLGLECTESAFNGSAYGTGPYGRHAPGFGVCVEPDRYNPEQVDERTGNLAFTRCEFKDNFSAFLAAYIDNYQGTLRLTNCNSSNSNNAPNHMIIHWAGGATMEGGVHDTGEGRIWTSWTGPAGGDLVMRDIEVRSAGHFGIYHEFAGSRLRMEKVRLIGRHTKAEHGSFPAIEADPGRGRKNLVKDCEFFIPAARKSPEQLYDLEPSFNHTLCENNLFRTDLPARGGQHFATQYGPGTVVRGDRYRGSQPGPQDSFRPAHNSRHDTRLPYSRG